MSMEWGRNDGPPHYGWAAVLGLALAAAVLGWVWYGI